MREWRGMRFAKSQGAVENGKKLEENGCEVISCAPMTLRVMG